MVHFIIYKLIKKNVIYIDQDNLESIICILLHRECLKIHMNKFKVLLKIKVLLQVTKKNKKYHKNTKSKLKISF